MENKKSIPTELTPAEWLVMQAVWERTGEEPEVTVSEVLPEISKKRDWHFSTLKTTMDRLVKKGVLTSRLRGKTCFYQPAVTREQATRRTLGSFLDMVLGEAVGPLVAYLAERRGLNKNEIEEMERLLAEKAQAREGAQDKARTRGKERNS